MQEIDLALVLKRNENKGNAWTTFQRRSTLSFQSCIDAVYFLPHLLLLEKRKRKRSLDHWFPTILILWSFNTVPHVMVTPSYKFILLLLCYYYCAAAINHNVRIWHAGYLIYDPCGRVVQPPKGLRPTGREPLPETLFISSRHFLEIRFTIMGFSSYKGRIVLLFL